MRLWLHTVSLFAANRLPLNTLLATDIRLCQEATRYILAWEASVVKFSCLKLKIYVREGDWSLCP